MPGTRGLLMVVVFLAVLAALLAVGLPIGAAEKTTLTGIISQGVAGFILTVADGTSYLLIQKEDLSGLSGRQFKVTGLVGQDDKGNPTLTVDAMEEVR